MEKIGNGMKVRHRIWVCRDGEEALDFLHNCGSYADREEYPKPDIILLDLRMPKVGGIEVLKQMQSEENLKDIPVIVLTTSDRDDDILKSYEMGVRSYLTKPALFVRKTGEMSGVLDALLSFASA